MRCISLLCHVCRGKMGKAPDPAPKAVGTIIAKVLTWLGPKGLEFGRYSTDYHYIRNFIYVNRHMGPTRADRHIPEFAKRLVAMYNDKGEIDARSNPSASAFYPERLLCSTLR